MVGGRQHVLPDQLLLWHFRAEIARARAEIAMGQLEPGAGEGFRKGLRIFQEPARDLLVGRIEAQREVGGQHGRLALLRRIMRVRDDSFGVLGFPLDSAAGAAGLYPFVLEQVLEEEVAPLRRRLGPGDLDAAADRVRAEAGAVVAGPAQALLLQTSTLRSRPLVRLGRGAMGLPAPPDQHPQEPAPCETRARRHGSCRRCGRRRSARPSPRRSSPCGQRFRE